MEYHMPMAIRKEVLVQLDDELLAKLDKLAKNEGVSRSELIRRGAMALLVDEQEQSWDRELVAAYRRLPPDEDLIESSKRMADETAPKW